MLKWMIVSFTAIGTLHSNKDGESTCIC